MGSAIAAHLSRGNNASGEQLPALSNQLFSQTITRQPALILPFLMHRDGVVIHLLQ